MGKFKYVINGESSSQPAVAAFDVIESGLTKREAFAMAAMQGLIANHTLRGPHEECAELALCYADALLKELEK